MEQARFLVFLLAVSLLGCDKGQDPALAFKVEGIEDGVANLWVVDADSREELQLLAHGGIFLEGTFLDEDQSWIEVTRKMMSNTQGVYFFEKGKDGKYVRVDHGAELDKLWDALLASANKDWGEVNRSSSRLVGFDSTLSVAKFELQIQFRPTPENKNGEEERVFEMDLSKLPRVPAPLGPPL